LGVQQAKESIEQLKVEAKRLEREGKFSEVAEIQYGKIPAAKEQLEQFTAQLADLQEQGTRIVKEEVRAEDIAEIVATN